MKLKNNGGYTLVELIICMAVFAVISGAILLFMTTGTRSYSRTKSTLDLQMETQTLMSQINTMVQESNRAVFDSSNNMLTLYSLAQIHTSASPAVTTYPAGVKGDYGEVYVTGKKVIYYSKTNSALYFKEYADDSTVTIADMQKADNLFSSYISDFDVSSISDTGKVNISLSMQNKKSKFSAMNNMKMRNWVYNTPAPSVTP